jgi:hypothetical protein
MTTLTTTFSRPLRRPGAAYRTYSRPSSLKRFRYFIEHSDWNDSILAHEEQANRLCVGVIIAAVLSFLPSFIRLLLRLMGNGQ